MQASFLQSKEWEEFQNRIGRKTWRVENNLIILHELPWGFSYLYCPQPNAISPQFAETIKKQTSANAIFLKIDPLDEFKIQNSKFKIRISNNLQPRETVILDLTGSEAEIMATMHEKTRYNIRLSERKGVMVRSGAGEKDFEAFLSLLQETASRDRFHLHEKEYYRHLLNLRSPEFSNELFFAEYKGEAVAALMANFYKPSGTAVYMHGASSRVHSEVMAPYALHWHVIREARRRGLLFYDLWGIDLAAWPGLTRFKKGFGGEIVERPETVDVVYRPFWYALYRRARHVF